MKLKNLMTAVVVFTAGPAFADEIHPYADQSKFAGTKTRAEVRAEIELAYAEGRQTAVSTPEFVEFIQVASTRSREEVHAEAIQAARAVARFSLAGS